ncbi:hypothetical protein HMI56_004217 [Coelomomyces lativittatus]|nr:hypothetical protein HMI56_004217 [Coelomomyces lativittatus]
MDPQKRRSLNGMTPMSTSPGHLSSILEEKYSPTYGAKRGNYNIAALTSSLNVSNDLNGEKSFFFFLFFSKMNCHPSFGIPFPLTLFQLQCSSRSMIGYL